MIHWPSFVSLLFWQTCFVSPSRSRRQSRSYGIPGNASFDYIIIGGGNTGLPVAATLASNPNLSIAVIEAGGFYENAGNTSVVPGYAPLFAGTSPLDTNPLVDWGFNTIAQEV